MKTLENINLGDEGPHVEALQRCINMSGLGPLDADGKYGPVTASAAKTFFAGMGVTYDAAEIPSALWQGVVLDRGLGLLLSLFGEAVSP